MAETKALTVQQKAFSLRDYMHGDKIKEQLESALPKWLSVERLLRVFMAAIQKTPKLLDCSQESIVISCIQCAQLGLEPILGRAWLIPYMNSKKVNGKWIKVLECQMQPGYQGLIDLARRSNAISDVYGLNVYENDDFDISFGTDRHIHHKPWYLSKGAKDPGEVIGTYVVWQLKDGTKHPEFMHIFDIHKRRDRSQGYQTAVKYDSKDNPWMVWPEEMNLKTVVKHSSKMVPASIEFMQGVELDDFSERGRTYIPDPGKSNLFLPQIEETPPTGEPDNGDEFKVIQDELVSKGVSLQTISQIIKDTAEKEKMTVEEVEASACGDKEGFIEAVLNAQKPQTEPPETQGKEEPQINIVEWLIAARPSTSPTNAKTWLAEFEKHKAEVDALDQKQKTQLYNKLAKTKGYLDEKEPPQQSPGNEPPPANTNTPHPILNGNGLSEAEHEAKRLEISDRLRFFAEVKNYIEAFGGPKECLEITKQIPDPEGGFYTSWNDVLPGDEKGYLNELEFQLQKRNGDV